MVNDNQDDWDQFIVSTLFSIRVKMQMTTKFSPFYLMFHREAKVPTHITMSQPVIPDFCYTQLSNLNQVVDLGSGYVNFRNRCKVN